MFTFSGCYQFIYFYSGYSLAILVTMLQVLLVLMTAYSSAAMGQLFFFHVVLIRKVIIMVYLQDITKTIICVGYDPSASSHLCSFQPPASILSLLRIPLGNGKRWKWMPRKRSTCLGVKNEKFCF